MHQAKPCRPFTVIYKTNKKSDLWHYNEGIVVIFARKNTIRLTDISVKTMKASYRQLNPPSYVDVCVLMKYNHALLKICSVIQFLSAMKSL